VFKHFNFFVGDKAILSVTTRDIELYKSQRSSHVSAPTVNQDIRCLRAFFNRLRVWNIIDRNPCDTVREIRSVDTIRPYLSKEDLQKLLRHTGGTQLHDIILFGAMTGLRKGEILNLT
jgi:site-specific recombinase XerD